MTQFAYEIQEEFLLTLPFSLGLEKQDISFCISSLLIDV